VARFYGPRCIIMNALNGYLMAQSQMTPCVCVMLESFWYCWYDCRL